MLTLRKKSVEKRNSRGDIVRKEEVVTVTKKIQGPGTAFPSDLKWNPNFSLSPILEKDTNRNPKFSPIPNKDTNKNPKFSLSPIPTKDTNNSPKFPLSTIPNKEYGHPLGNAREIPPGSGMQDFNAQKDPGRRTFQLAVRSHPIPSHSSTFIRSDVDKYIQQNSNGSDLQDFKRLNNQGGYNCNGNVKGVKPPEGSDVEDYDEDTNLEESEAEDLSSEESEGGDTNYEESEFEESEVEESEVEESEVEDMSSEESEVEDINSEESSEVEEDLDDEPPRHVTDINRSLSNLSLRRKNTDINPSMRKFPSGR